MTAACPDCGYELDLAGYPPGAVLRCPDCRTPIPRPRAAATLPELAVPARDEPIEVEELVPDDEPRPPRAQLDLCSFRVPGPGSIAAVPAHLPGVLR